MLKRNAVTKYVQQGSRKAAVFPVRAPQTAVYVSHTVCHTLCWELHAPMPAGPKGSARVGINSVMTLTTHTLGP